jgi:hypothetical protein
MRSCAVSRSADDSRRGVSCHQLPTRNLPSRPIPSYRNASNRMHLQSLDLLVARSFSVLLGAPARGSDDMKGPSQSQADSALSDRHAPSSPNHGHT